MLGPLRVFLRINQKAFLNKTTDSNYFDYRLNKIVLNYKTVIFIHQNLTSYHKLFIQDYQLLI